MATISLIDYQFATENDLPPIAQGKLYAYVFAGNGIFLRAERPGLKVLLPLADSSCIKGLPNVEPYVGLDAFVPKSLLEWILITSWERYPSEILFWLHCDNKKWSTVVPSQYRTTASVVPIDKFDPLGTHALIDLHSHASYSAFFSVNDDKDEQGFRVYAVVGDLNFDKPSIKVRVGVYGNFFDIPANLIFEVPSWIADMNNGEF